MTFNEWEKEHSSEICPHTPKQLGYTVTRCRECVWQAAQKEMPVLSEKWFEQGKKEARKEMAKKLIQLAKRNSKSPVDNWGCMEWLEKEAKG
jgi:hypothetical protein